MGIEHVKNNSSLTKSNCKYQNGTNGIIFSCETSSKYVIAW